MATDRIFKHFENGQTALREAQCGNLTDERDKIVSLMYVPLIQNLLHAAYKLATNKTVDGERDRSYGIFFARVMQPKLASCDQEVADIVGRNMLVPG